MHGYGDMQHMFSGWVQVPPSKLLHSSDYFAASLDSMIQMSETSAASPTLSALETRSSFSKQSFLPMSSNQRTGIDLVNAKGHLLPSTVLELNIVAQKMDFAKTLHHSQAVDSLPYAALLQSPTFQTLRMHLNTSIHAAWEKG